MLNRAKFTATFLFAFVTGLFFVFSPQTIRAATFVVVNNGDTSDAATNDGICADASGFCTLRAAIEEANALAGDDVINFAPALANQTIAVGSTLNATTNVTIDATGVTGVAVSGGNVVRVFNLTGGAIIMRAFTIRNGVTFSSDGAGINANGTALTLGNMTISNNTANSGGGAGAFINGGSLSVRASTFQSNATNTSTAAGDGGALFLNNVTSFSISGSTFADNEAVGRGGAIRAAGSTGNLSNSDIFSNRAPGAGTSAGFGGGVYVSTGAVSVVNTTIRANTSRSTGAGLYFISGTHRVIGTTISGNVGTASATANGGGVTIGSGATVTMINSTVSNNTTSASGGGFFIQGNLTLRNVTIAFNKSVNAVQGAGLFRSGGTTMAMANTIVTDSADNAGNAVPDVAGTINSLGFNLVRARGGSGGYVASDLPDGTNPLLGTLANNGGFTETHALSAGSPAIDAGDNSLAVDSSNGSVPLVRDQRGFERIVDAPLRAPVVDIGAYEFSLVPTAASVAVGGRVTVGKNRGVAGAQIYLTDAAGNTRTARTNSLGYYRFADVPAGATYICSVSSKRYGFAPQVVSIVEEIEDLNFAAMP